MIAKVLILAAITVSVVHGHGYLKEPIARTSIHLRPDVYPDYHPPYWWDNQAVWCGNIQQDAQYSTCGRCGDAPGETTSNQGGIYDKGVIAATYESGSVITIEAEFGATHYGHFELELCPQEIETDDCFQKLPVVSASEEVRDGYRICMPHDGAITRYATAQVWLPAGVRCERCTIRWTYRTSYPGRQDWDACDNPYSAQAFRNCADVKIV